MTKSRVLLRVLSQNRDSASRVSLCYGLYEQAVEPFRQTNRLSDSERAMLMGGACAKAYGWVPKKS